MVQSHGRHASNIPAYRTPAEIRQELSVASTETSGEEIEPYPMMAVESGEPHWADQPPTPVVIVREQDKPTVVHVFTQSYSLTPTSAVQIIGTSRRRRTITIAAGDADIRISHTNNIAPYSSYRIYANNTFTTHTTEPFYSWAADTDTTVSVAIEFEDDVE